MSAETKTLFKKKQRHFASRLEHHRTRLIF